jgi:hypothetical protein
MKKGDRVVCINASIKPGKLSYVGFAYPNWIKEGSTYTIRAILPNDDIVPGILLEEVRNPLTYIHLLGREQEPAFGTFRFKPLEHTADEATEKEVETIGLEELLGV